MKKIIALATLVILSCEYSQAQIIKRKANEVKIKTEQRVENKTSEGIDKTLDKIEEGIGNLFKKKKKKETNKSENDNSMNNTNNSPSSGTNSGDNDETDFSEYKAANFDFIPGKNTIFFEDFKSTSIGKTTGNWIVHDWNPENNKRPVQILKLEGSDETWLKTPRKGVFYPVDFSDFVLPHEFTLEMDIYADVEIMTEMEGGLSTIFVKKPVDKYDFSFHWNENHQIQLDVHPSERLLYTSATREYKFEKRDIFSKEWENAWNIGEINRVSIYRNGTHVKLYVNENKYIDLPNALPPGDNYTFLFATNMWGDGIYVSNIRLAGDVVTANKEVKAAGKFVTNTIYFDYNAAWIKPESWATLKDIATTILQDGGVFKIVGHTDSDGTDQSNQVLSEKRANAVKNVLIKEFGVPADKLSAEGKGEAEPIATNNTPSGKAENRRVEFIKQ